MNLPDYANQLLAGPPRPRAAEYIASIRAALDRIEGRELSEFALYELGRCDLSATRVAGLAEMEDGA